MRACNKVFYTQKYAKTFDLEKFVGLSVIQICFILKMLICCSRPFPSLNISFYLFFCMGAVRFCNWVQIYKFICNCYLNLLRKLKVTLYVCINFNH